VGSNTSAVSLRVLGDDEKRTQCLGVQLDHPVPEEAGPSGWRNVESEPVRYGYESHMTRTRE
jgi:hypothetical protein